jgi:hypothetical protein
MHPWACEGTYPPSDVATAITTGVCSTPAVVSPAIGLRGSTPAICHRRPGAASCICLSCTAHTPAILEQEGEQRTENIRNEWMRTQTTFRLLGHV